MNTQFEVIIIGGGPAGLSAALVLGRSRVKVLLLNAEAPRNAVTKHSHGFLPFDGKHPFEILEESKKVLDKYKSIVYKNDEVIDLVKDEEGFVVTTSNFAYKTKRVVVATGYKDNIQKLAINGLEEVYGKSVYPCPFCDGYELYKKKIAVFANAETISSFVKLISHWSNDITGFTNGEEIKDLESLVKLKEKGILIIEKPIKKLHSKEGELIAVELFDGTLIECEAGFCKDTKAAESANFLAKFNIPFTFKSQQSKLYTVNENKETTIKGLYIIGDAKNTWSGVANAVAEGSDVGQAITRQVATEFWN